ncbi:MAG: zinc ribbon domain-containing protein [Acidobacteria bacterium]|nr:zinc ribbon domain-containing protein [Acidobacteriota bacterium]
MTQSETKQLQAQRLPADRIHALLGELGLNPTKDSPLIGLPRQNGAVSSNELAQLGLLDEPWPKAMGVLCAPIACVRSMRAFPDRTMVAVWYRAEDSDDGTSVGYWPEDGMMQITAPCRMTDHVEHATGALATHLVRDIRDPLQVDLTVPCLAAMAAAIDVVRADMFESMLRRAGRCSEWFAVERLHDTYAAGRSELDARWLTSLLHLLMPVSMPIPEQVPAHALTELAALGLIERDRDHWRASEALLRLASYWKTALPAIAHEVIAPDRYRYLIAFRGDGPLFTLDFWRTRENNPGVTLASIRERDYQQALQGLLQSFYTAKSPPLDAAEQVHEAAHSADRYCPNCNTANTADSVFCKLCATRLSGTQAPPISRAASPARKENIPAKDDGAGKEIRCHVCGHVQERKGKFCSRCGAVFCTYCGNYVRKGSFCSICGKRL